MMRHLKRLGKLTSPEYKLFFLAAGMVPLTAVGLHLLGFQRWYKLLSRTAGRRGAAAIETPELNTAAMIPRTLRCLYWAIQYGLYGGNCLSRSLTLWWLLRRQGIVTELRIGVRQETGQFQAHAWVEYKGQPLNEHAQVHQQYTVFAKVIAPQSADGWSVHPWPRKAE